MLNYLSLFSGIEAASVAWKKLDLEPLAFSEIDEFPSEILKYRFPNVPNLGNIINVDWSKYNNKIDVIVGGSPCFVAGTQVMCIDGMRSIEDIQVGDLVCTHNFRWKRVSKIGNQLADTIIIKGDGVEKYIECTPNHPFLIKTSNGVNSKLVWMSAKDILNQQWIKIGLSSNGNPCFLAYGVVHTINSGNKNIRVYNLEVEDDHSYTVEGIAVHNCQSFSIAGNRKGLSGTSGLMYEYIRAVRELMPRIFLWENVPGALSSTNGEDFRCLLASLDDLGYGLAWRVLDSQFFGVPQRRRRLFLIGCLGDPKRAAQILLEPEGLRWDNSSSRKKREELTRSLRQSTSHTRITAFKYSTDSKTNTSTSDSHVRAIHIKRPDTYSITLSHTGSNGLGISKEIAPTLDCAPPGAVFQEAQIICSAYSQENINLLACNEKENPYFVKQETLRRLTPVECERLQGFPDNWTRIPWKGKDALECPDSPRYKAIGNSMTIPVMEWIGEQIIKSI